MKRIAILKNSPIPLTVSVYDNGICECRELVPHVGAGQRTTPNELWKWRSSLWLGIPATTSVFLCGPRDQTHVVRFVQQVLLPSEPSPKSVAALS